MTNQVYLGRTRSEAKVNQSADQSKNQLFKRLTPTRETAEKNLTEENDSSSKITDWNYDMKIT